MSDIEEERAKLQKLKTELEEKEKRLEKWEKKLAKREARLAKAEAAAAASPSTSTAEPKPATTTPNTATAATSDSRSVEGTSPEDKKKAKRASKMKPRKPEAKDPAATKKKKGTPLLQQPRRQEILKLGQRLYLPISWTVLACDFICSNYFVIMKSHYRINFLTLLIVKFGFVLPHCSTHGSTPVPSLKPVHTNNKIHCALGKVFTFL